MTISAQHVRAALSHLRSGDPAWRSILKSVGPFTVRVERSPAWWLTHHLHCRSFWDFAELRDTFEGSREASEGRLNATFDERWGPAQRDFWTEVQTVMGPGNLELAASAATEKMARTRDRLRELLERYQSTIIDRFYFYCWGGLDSWPASDPHLLELVATCAFAKSSVDPNSAAAIVGTWAPYRSVAAWYLERWGEIQRSEKSE